MKIKHTMKVAILSALTAMGGSILFTSCEDMFNTDNGLVTDNLAPKDTVYTMMGIVKNMQRIMDRTVIFGELRSDLVDVGLTTPSDLRDIATFDVTEDNAYNDPRDFYNVINSCNIYLANVDAQRRSIHTGENSYGELYFEKEIIATKCYRAWTYLQLAQIYGAQNIPFITDPVITADAAEQMVADTGNRTTMDALCTFFINDIKQYADKIEDNELLVPDYSVTFEAGQETNTKISYRKFFIPVRLMLAELYLWRGSNTQSVADFREAVRYYHEFLTHGLNTANYLLGANRVAWAQGGTERFSGTSNNYYNQFRLASTGMVAVIPMDTTTYYGNTSNIREVFSSKHSNNYYPAAVPSECLKEIFQAQDYLYVDYTTATSFADIVPEYAPKDEASLRTRFQNLWWMYVGDLRFKGIYSHEPNSNVDHADWSTDWWWNAKWETKLSDKNELKSAHKPEFIPLYRLAIVYLHLAEALNRAGFPESAFVILKYGLSTSALRTYAASEFDDLKLITSVSSKDINFTEWDVNYFVTVDNVTFTNVKEHLFNQWPVHAYGCGDVYFDDNYTIGASLSDPKYAVGDESVIAVLDDNGDVILDEEGNPDLTADGTKVYNYGSWYLTSGGSIVWNGYLWSVVPEQYQTTMSYDDYIAYLSESEDLSEKTPEELQTLYDTYENDCNLIKSIYNHNTKLKANALGDMQADVAEKILTEEALEGMFEGHRFGDLMRYSWQEGNPALLGQAVSKRPGTTTPDATLAGKLASEAGWYVKLPTR